MANYEALARSNYFRVKSDKEEEFKDKCNDAGWDYEKRDDGTYCLTSPESGIPTYYNCCFTDDDSPRYREPGEELEIDYGKDFGHLLEDGQVMHLTECGYEKLRYLTGFGMWIRSDGKVFQKNIHDAPTAVKNFCRKHNTTITDCSY